MADPRDGWAKFDIGAKAFASLGLPIIIGLLGYWHNQTEKESSRRELAQRDSLAREERRADRVTSLIGRLASTNERERLMAIRVAEELGEQGQLPSELVPVLRDIAQGGISQAERTAAGSAVESALAPRREELFSKLFGPDATTRKATFSVLLVEARKDSALVPALLRYAAQNIGNTNGIFNTLSLLTEVCPNPAIAPKTLVGPFVADVRARGAPGPKVQELIGQVSTRCS